MVVLIILLACFAEPDQRLYDGRSLAAWQGLIGRIELRDPASREYVPGLIALMDDPQVPWTTRRQAALTLGRLGPLARDAVPRVVAHLEETCDEDPETAPQRWALSSLALFGREAKSATPQLAALLTHETSSVVARLGCLEALSQIGSADPAAIRAVIAELERHLPGRSSHDQELAFAATEALGMIGADAAPGVPLLMRALQFGDEPLRHAAANSLGRIGPAARDAEPVLFDLLLGDESPLVRDAAMTALAQLGPTGWLRIEPLLAAEEIELRERAATIVQNWPALSAVILPALEPLLNDDAPRVRLAAAKSWRRLTGRHERVWTVFIDLLCEPERELRRGAWRELQAIVQTGDVTEQEFAQLADDPRPEVRDAAERLSRERKP